MAIVYPGALDSFTTKYDNVDDVMAADVNNLALAIVELEEKVGITSSPDATSLDYKVNSRISDFFAAGRKLWLYENTAPTGWSVVAVSDVALAVKGGAGAYNVNGGNVAGAAWATLKAHVHTGPNHLHAGGAHVHSIEGNHLHKWYEANMTNADDQSYDSDGNLVAIALQDEKTTFFTLIPATEGGQGPQDLWTSKSVGAVSTGSGGTENTGYGGTGNTGAQDTADVRPTAAVGIIVTKS